MKIPLIWLQDYIKTNKTPKEIAESFTALGLMLDKPITSDNVLDLEHRFDRSDWLAILGCARDLAAFENTPLIYPDRNAKPGKPATSETKVKLKVDCPDLVRRFNTRVFKNITVKESPAWMQEKLKAYGLPTINNIVDITNFVMVECGQPMHAQDLAKFQKREIHIRLAKDGEKIVSLDGTNVELDKSMFVLTQNDKPIVIGGVVGGKVTGVDEHTTEIVLDAGNYDQGNIRKTARKLKIQNETVLRYDKFLNPALTELALERATYLIEQLAGGEYYENEDYYPNPYKSKKMKLTYARVQLISGIAANKDAIKTILTALEYKNIKEHSDGLELEIPYFRTDIEVEDDIVADVLRISDYKNIPLAQINSAPPTEITSKIYKFEEKLRDALIALGGHEHITDTMTQFDGTNKEQISIQNSYDPEKNALRTDIYQTLYPIVENYKKHGQTDILVFEIGKVYLKENNKYPEIRKLTVICSKHSDVYENSENLKTILSGLFMILGIENVSYKKQDKVVEIWQNNLDLGYLTYNAFTLNTENLVQSKKTLQRVSDKISQDLKEDISVSTKIDFEAGKIVDEIKTFENVEKVEVLETHFADNNESKSILFRITFVNQQNKTEIINHLESKLGIKVKR
ncbi:MAG TPA: phenylalanine--tRNA ligase beta subunit-related protein [Candidatus Saccharimonadales bacterium]|nr:phenylalanine--tRNA ligase beta subunit-related protein [Candidatus Saccharimonadales bacterium]